MQPDDLKTFAIAVGVLASIGTFAKAVFAPGMTAADLKTDLEILNLLDRDHPRREALEKEIDLKIRGLYTIENKRAQSINGMSGCATFCFLFAAAAWSIFDKVWLPIGLFVLGVFSLMALKWHLEEFDAKVAEMNSEEDETQTEPPSDLV